MDCETIRKRQIADEYRVGRLSPEEAEAYERHFFECDRCFEDLRFRDRLARVIEREGESLFEEERLAEERERARKAARIPGRQRFGWWGSLLRPAWAGGLVAVAAAVVALFAIQSSERTARFKTLVQPVPYPYVALELRGEEGREAFERGMELYVAGHYEEAAQELKRSAELDPDDADTRFYLGVSLLLSGEPGDAVRALESAVRLVPSNGLYRWYLAQALLRDGRVGRAEEELVRLAGEGEYAGRAKDLLEKITAERSR